jgi:hypothetical protein
VRGDVRCASSGDDALGAMLLPSDTLERLVCVRAKVRARGLCVKFCSSNCAM